MRPKCSTNWSRICRTTRKEGTASVWLKSKWENHFMIFLKWIQIFISNNYFTLHSVLQYFLATCSAFPFTNSTLLPVIWSIVSSFPRTRTMNGNFRTKMPGRTRLESLSTDKSQPFPIYCLTSIILWMHPAFKFNCAQETFSLLDSTLFPCSLTFSKG